MATQHPMELVGKRVKVSFEGILQIDREPFKDPWVALHVVTANGTFSIFETFEVEEVG